jgi:hypothetical protein
MMQGRQMMFRTFVNTMLRLICVGLLSSLTACSGSYTHTLSFDPKQPIRVAVVPFAQVDAAGAIVDDDGSLLVDGVPLLSEEVKEKPTDIVQKIVQRELRETNLDILAPYLISVELPHHGFGNPDGSFDLERIHSEHPSQICIHSLDCDSVLYGTITEWDRAYYGLQSVNSVAISLVLKDARTGLVLFSAKAKDSESRGLTKGPTGYTSIVLEPIKGLDSAIIAELAEATAKKMLAPLRAKRDPALIAAPPPAILATALDAKGEIARNKPLIVVTLGSPGNQASFSIGRTIQNIPMQERSPGNYYGEYYPLPQDTFSNEFVTVYLRDEVARTTSRRVSTGAVSLK